MVDRYQWYKNLIARLIGYDEANLVLLEDEDTLKIKNDEELMLAIIEEDPTLFHLASDKLKNSKKVAINAVKRDGKNYIFVSDELKLDHDIALICCQRYEKNIEQAFELFSSLLKEDKMFALKVVTLNGAYLQYLDKILWFDETIVKLAYKNNPDIINFLPDDCIALIFK